MVIYNKHGAPKKSSKKIISSGGPRDRQAKLAENKRNEDIESLRKDLDKITTNMSASSVGYSKDKLDSMINDAIEETTIELEKKYIEEIENLKKELGAKDKLIEEFNSTVAKLNDKLDKKDNTILELTDKISSIYSGNFSNSTHGTEDVKNVSETMVRPSIDKVFIDPSKKLSEDNYESHVKVKEKESTKTSVTDNLNKLKDIVGGKKIT